jgi:hypothetical protein
MSYRPNGLEHRWGTRALVNIPVRVEATSLPAGDGCMKNLSLSGALMKSDRDLVRSRVGSLSGLPADFRT